MPHTDFLVLVFFKSISRDDENDRVNLHQPSVSKIKICLTLPNVDDLYFGKFALLCS